MTIQRKREYFIFDKEVFTKEEAIALATLIWNGTKGIPNPEYSTDLDIKVDYKSGIDTKIISVSKKEDSIAVLCTINDIPCAGLNIAHLAIDIYNTINQEFEEPQLNFQSLAMSQMITRGLNNGSISLDDIINGNS